MLSSSLRDPGLRSHYSYSLKHEPPSPFSRRMVSTPTYYRRHPSLPLSSLGGANSHLPPKTLDSPPAPSPSPSPPPPAPATLPTTTATRPLRLRHGRPSYARGTLVQRLSFLRHEARHFLLAGPILYCFRRPADPADPAQTPGALHWTADLRRAQVLGDSPHRRLTLKLAPGAAVDGSLSAERVVLSCPDDKAFRRWFRELVVAASRQVRDHYRFQRIVARGASSWVALAKDRLTSETVAVKVMRKAQVHWEQLACARREPGALLEMGHCENIIRVLDVYESPQKLYLVMEFVPGGTLEDFVQKNGPMREKDIASVLCGLLRALQRAHAHGIVHRDIKPEQVLLRNSQNIADGVVLCDWGLARKLPFDEQAPPDASADEFDAKDNYIGPLCGSAGFLAPEVVARTAHDQRADVWAAGITFHYMVTGTCPFDRAPSRQAALQVIASLRGEPVFAAPEWAEASLEARHLCKAMLRADPEERITAREALQHPFFKQFNFN